MNEIYIIITIRVIAMISCFVVLYASIININKMDKKTSLPIKIASVVLCGSIFSELIHIMFTSYIPQPWVVMLNVGLVGFALCERRRYGINIGPHEIFRKAYVK